MVSLLKAIRLPECLLVVLLGIIGFTHTGIQPEGLILVTLFFVIAATMLQNDWRDRVHDLSKGKTFAHTKPVLFLFYVVSFWILSSSFIVILFFKHPYTSFLLSTMAFVGVIYSETRRIPLLPVSLVSITAASPLLFPISLGVSFSLIAPLFFATILILFGRETLHDIADTAVDRGYKKTIPLVINDKTARFLSAASLIIGCIILVYINKTALVGSLSILWGLLKITEDKKVTGVRRRVDIGLVCLVLGLLLF